MLPEFTIKVDIPKVPLLDERGQKVVSQEIERTMMLALQVGADELAKAVGSNADTGHTGQSFMANPATASGGIAITGRSEGRIEGRVFSTLVSAAVLSNGRQPGFGVNRAGIEALSGWARRKLGADDTSSRRIAFAVASKMRRRGWRPGVGVRLLHRGTEAARPKVQALFQALRQVLAEVLVKP